MTSLTGTEIRPVPGSTAHISPAFLADRAAIEDLIAAYGVYYDSGDFEALGDLFTEEASFAFTPPPPGFPPAVTTRARIVRAMAALYRHNLKERGAHQRHVTANTVITSVDGGTARARSLLTVVFAFDDGRQELGRSGGYVDRLDKQGARWRIADRVLWLGALPRGSA